MAPVSPGPRPPNHAWMASESTPIKSCLDGARVSGSTPTESCMDSSCVFGFTLTKSCLDGDSVSGVRAHQIMGWDSKLGTLYELASLVVNVKSTGPEAEHATSLLTKLNKLRKDTF